MLNISNNSIASRIDINAHKVLRAVESKKSGKIIQRIIIWSIIIILIILILPWTQNIRTSGSLTTLNPDQRPQEIQSVISGRIDEWRVKEGDLVKKGDTIAIISEIKDAYFDVNLLKGLKISLT